MKYYKAIEETNIGNNGNYCIQTRYEVFDLYLTKIYICGYDYVTNNTRHLEVELSENMNNYKQILIYNESGDKKDIFYNYGYNSNKQLYDLVKKIYNIHYKDENETEYDYNYSCSAM